MPCWASAPERCAASLWRAGRSAPTRWLDLLAVPKRYFVDLHHVVARDPYIARTHIATAGAAVAAMLLVALNYGLALYWQFLDMAIALAALVMLTGLAFVWLRRRHPPARLSRGLWNRLPWMLGRWRWACCCWARCPPRGWPG